jgi:hypothetical protein
MTYIYVKQDLRFLDDPQSQALLKAFLQSLYDDDFVQQCVDAYEFAKVDSVAFDLAQNAIASLQVNDAAIEFTFESEDDTMLVDGQDRYVISAKRQSAAEVEFDRLAVTNQDLEERLVDLELRLMQATSVLNAMESSNGGSSTFSGTAAEEGQDAEIAAALALSIISIIFCVVIGLGLLCRFCTGSHSDNKSDVENPR